MLLGTSAKIAASAALAMLIGTTTFVSKSGEQLPGAGHADFDTPTEEISSTAEPFFRKHRKTPGEFLCLALNKAMPSIVGEDLADPKTFRSCVGALTAIGLPPTLLIMSVITAIAQQMKYLGQGLLRRMSPHDSKSLVVT